ncbi:MAG: type II toxin-antitoxin system RelE/ParE family toxin [Pseudonocardiaceae bacterium]
MATRPPPTSSPWPARSATAWPPPSASPWCPNRSWSAAPSERQLDGKLRELRFHLGGQAVRVTYWIASGRRIVLLTVFGKTRMRESREIDRARQALRQCIAAEHTADEDDEE